MTKLYDWICNIVFLWFSISFKDVKNETEIVNIDTNNKKPILYISKMSQSIKYMNIPVIILSSIVVIRNINGDFRTMNLGNENIVTTTA